MGSSPSSSPAMVPCFGANIQTSDGKTFQIYSHDLLDHICLLRQVISHPEMTQKGETLTYFIEDYCTRMAHQKMGQERQQRKLPWQIEWIWHVHRLHPIAYNKDCTQQLPDGKLVDKKDRAFRIREHQKTRSVISSEPTKGHSTFVPSIDLTSAVLRQYDFLEQFKQHRLFSIDLQLIDRDSFEQMVQNYISFMKLAKQNEVIVPTFEIDLIWHTHMRYPSHYQIVSKTLCGFLLDHDDAIEKDILQKAYQQTANRWETTYKVDYGENIDKDNLRTSQYVSSCALVIAPIKAYSSNDGSGGGGACGGGCGGGGC